ncbi:hypothetical protein J2W35_004946 [Variovorax boronicumulans]|uniref:hypothetical protein n=1 Tax=Variovorax boronicumulans TaxID=436515 RepID=UPI0027863B9E|nr:hypothetical protein [Variovorax boronicumulans]MDQ0084577.1 hypothetical protein [Variovorax boronicumulans]
MSIETHPLTFIDPVCGRAAFHVTAIPQPLMVMEAKDIQHVDGRPVMPGEMAVCDSCRRQFYMSGALDRRLLIPANYVPRGIEAA